MDERRLRAAVTAVVARWSSRSAADASTLKTEAVNARLAEFQKARGPETEEDAALQFYLRRLEPLLLQLTQWPVE